MEDNFKNLEVIEKQIQEYFEMSFDNEQEDYIYNKSLKIKIRQLIIESKTNDDGIVDAALLVLAKSTGCAEDQEIADEILNDLLDNGYVDRQQFNFFYENVATRRWM